MKKPSLWVLALLATTIMITDGYDMQIMPILVPLLADLWQMAPADFSITQSAAVLGIGVGSALLGPLGDRYGRRKTIIPSFIVTTLSVTASAYINDIDQLSVARFFTGLGLGVCIVNINALLAKHCPNDFRALILTVVACGIPIGAIISGWGVPSLTPNYGWQSGFLLSGIISFIIVILLLTLLPKDHQEASIQREQQTFSVLELLKPALRNTTLALWVLYIGNSFLLYALVSWIPTLLTQGGWTLAKAGGMIAYFQIGGLIGSLLVAGLMDKWGVFRALSATYLIAGLCFISFSLHSNESLWPAMIALIGACISSVQLTMNALSASVYPNRCLASGIGFTVAVARIGAVTAPLAGGAMIAAGFGIEVFMALLLVPLAVCLASIYLLARYSAE